MALNGRLHLIGGAGAPTMERASVGWHEVYDPQTDQWTTLKALPGARDHVGVVAHNSAIHIIGGRFNTFEYNTGLHHVYLPARETWEERAPLPTARSGHGLVLYRGRFFAMGGEGGSIERGVTRNARVFGQMESYDPAADTWESHARCRPAPCRRRGQHRRLDLCGGRRRGAGRRGAILGARSVQPRLSRFDAIILGAGAAGLMAAISAGRRGRRVLLSTMPRRRARRS